MKVVFLGLSITSSWGNGHATNYRGLMRALTERGHDCVFFERDVPWYASNRDLPDPPWGRTELYTSVDDLRQRARADVADADLVVIGSYVPEGVAVATWALQSARGVTAFYDIDTPVTLAALDRGECEYLTPDLVPRFDLYLSFTGGPTLDRIEQDLGSPRAVAFYCMVDPERYFPEDVAKRWDLGYLGTYSDDRQPAVQRLLIEPATRWPEGRFVVAGPQYPDDIRWPPNVERIDHLPPDEHRRFYNGQRFTLNVTRADMVRAGYSPSVRLFEAAGCGVPVVSDPWPGLDEIFDVGTEILVARSADEALSYLRDVGDDEAASIGRRARDRVLREHTAEHRAEQLETYVREVHAAGRRR